MIKATGRPARNCLETLSSLTRHANGNKYLELKAVLEVHPETGLILSSAEHFQKCFKRHTNLLS